MKSGKKHKHKKASDRSGDILLAEDDLEMRKLLSWSLEHKGYKVTECSDGTGLMRKLGLLGPYGQIHSYDLIISDIRMPGATGLQVLESVREFPDFPPMILITAFPDAESTEQARRLGAAAMMAKPFDVEELLDKVGEAIPPESAGPRQNTQPPTDGRAPFPFGITFRHDSGSEAAKEYIWSIAAKMHSFADHIINGRIIVDQLGRQHLKKHRYTVTLVLTTYGKSIVVKHNSDRGEGGDLYMTINMVFGTAFRQLKHYIEKRQEHRKHSTKERQFQKGDDPDDNESLETKNN
jgi:CheY-like chemotaxis protein/ribosome-associated translation inhibitor RaiA